MREAFVEVAPAWLEAIPAIGDALSAALQTSRQAADGPQLDDLAAQFEQLLHRVSNDAPVVIALDDLHWADTSTIDLIYRLSQRLQAAPILMLLGFRPHQGRAVPDGELSMMLHRLHRYTTVTALELQPLGADAIAALAKRRSVQMAPDDCSDLASHTGGNPLFILELLGLFVERQQARRLPPRIESVVLERLGFLSEEERELLEIASVLAPTVDRADLAALADMPDRELRRLLRKLTDAGLLLPDSEGQHYAFHHVMVADVVSQRLTTRDPFWFRELHAQALQRCTGTELDDHIRRAHHARESQHDEAAQFIFAAAQHALLLGALAEARSLATDALERVNDDALLTCRTRALLGLAAARLADHHVAVQALSQALDDARVLPPAGAPNEGEQLRWNLQRGYALRMLNRFDDAKQVVEELTGASDHDVVARAVMLRAEIELCGDGDARAAVRTLTAAERLDPHPAVLYRIQGHLGLALLVEGRVDHAARHLQIALQTAELTDDPFDRYEVIHWMSKHAMAVLDLGRAAELIDELDRLTRSTDVAKDVPFHLRDRSRTNSLRGRVEHAAADFAEYVSWVREPKDARDRLLSTLSLQCVELSDLHGVPTAVAFIEALATLLASHRHDEDVCAVLTRASAALAKGSMDPRQVAGGVDTAAYAAADAIFRFDVPDLARLRRQVAVP